MDIKTTLNINTISMKRLFLLAGVAALILGSCTQDLPEIDQNAPREVSFNTSGNGLLKADGDCALEADYALIQISGTVYTASTFVVNEVLYTQAIKLPPGNYTLEEFVLWNDNDTPDDTSDDIITSASPHVDAPFADLVVNALDLSFDVEAFLKVEIEVGVLCYEESTHDDFGFVWFKPNITPIKEKWFYGDLCTSIFINYEGSLYGDYPLVDMPAIYRIDLVRDDDLDGTFETPVNSYTNEGTYLSTPEGNFSEPLAVGFVDREGIEDRYEMQLWIYELVGYDVNTSEPVFEYRYYSSWYFNDSEEVIYNDPARTEPFEAGDDGIFDWVVGFCAYDNPDIEVPDPDEPQYDGCETAFAYGLDPAIPTCFLEMGYNRWGWSVALNPEVSTYFELPIYAGAGQCDLEKGTLVGTLIVELSGSTATVTYQMDSGYTMSETHLYIGSRMLPVRKDGVCCTISPGQYPDIHEGLEGAQTDVYVIEDIPSGELNVVAHAVVCGG